MSRTRRCIGVGFAEYHFVVVGQLDPVIGLAQSDLFGWTIVEGDRLCAQRADAKATSRL